MGVIDMFSSDICKLKKAKYLVLVPILIDLFTLFVSNVILKIAYIPINRTLLFKLGIISSPPSIRYILEDFPSVIFGYTSIKGYTGLISGVSLFTILLLLSAILVGSFIDSAYLSTLEKVNFEKVNLKYFFILGNRNWWKFLVLRIISFIPVVLMLYKSSFIALSFVMVIFYYVKFSIVMDEVSLKENFRNGLSFFMNNLGLSVKIIFFCGFVFSLASTVIFLLTTNIPLYGVVFSIITVAFLGVKINKTVIELYRNYSKFTQ